MDRIIGKELSALEVQNLVSKFPNEWFLLEVLKVDDNGKAKSVKVAAHNSEKDVLREFLLEHDHGDKRFIFFFADTENTCELE